LEKIMRKMMALMTVMQGMQQVANMLNKDSYVRVAAGLVLDKAKVWWTEVQTAATIKGTIAQKALNVAMKMNPIGLVIAAIMALVAAMGFYLNSLKKEREQQDLNNALSKVQREELIARGAAYKKAIDDIDGYIKKLEDQGKTELELILQSIELRRQQDLLIARAAGAIANETILVENLTTKQKNLNDQINAVDISTTAGLQTQKRLQEQYDGITKELIPLNEKLQTNKEVSEDLTTIINDNADAERKYVIELSKKTVGTEKQIKATKDIHKEIEDLYALLDKSITSKGSKFLDLQPQLKKQFEHIKEFNDLVLQNLGASESEKTAALLSNEEVRYAEELLRLADNHKAIEEATKIHVDNINAIKNGEDIKPPKDGEDGSPYDWKDYFSEIGSGANDTFSGISDLMDTLMDKELSNFKTVQDEKLRVLNERLRLGYISEEQYIADKSDLDIEYDKKKKELEKEQFKRTKAMAYAEAVINGALAAVEALNAKTTAMMVIKLAFVAFALSLQLAKIQAQTPGFEKGRKDGPGTFAKVGEGGWEFTGDGTNIFKTPNSTTLTYLKPHQWVMPHAESVQLEKVLGTPTVNQITTQKPQQQQDKELIKAIDRLAKKPTAVVNMDAHGIRAALFDGANSMNFVNNHILFKN
ncbi:MAG TPA: hypothetical protein PKL96_11435, partial [Bacteroidales bacterium]|nr:hypothetical protein [Bacteroidales bacterium]